MNGVSPDFGACLTSFAAAGNPLNGFSSRLEISGPQGKQEKQHWRVLPHIQKQCFLSTGH
jgi:hypothetical protein